MNEFGTVWFVVLVFAVEEVCNPWGYRTFKTPDGVVHRYHAQKSRVRAIQAAHWHFQHDTNKYEGPWLVSSKRSEDGGVCP